MNQTKVLDLSNHEAISTYFGIAKHAIEHDYKDLYAMCMEKIQSLLERDLGKVLLVDNFELTKAQLKYAMKHGVIFNINQKDED